MPAEPEHPAAATTGERSGVAGDPGGLLRIRRLSKRFGPVRALESVDLELRPGEILALLGENGAGKSTLIKCLTGVHRPDSGTMTLGDRAVAPQSPREAEALGISTVYQEVNLIPHLTVAENICLGREPVSFLGRVRWGLVRRRAHAALARVGISLDVDRELSSCSVAVRQLVAIARALDVRSRVLILDEPTSSLDRQEVGALFDVLRRLRSQGLAIVFVTHFLDQVYAISDRIAVLRDGRLIGVHGAKDLSRERLVSLMVGREFTAIPSRERGAAAADKGNVPLLNARGLSRRGSLAHVDVSVRAGEVVGLVGLLGSGRTETARAIFGADATESGQIRWKGAPTMIGSPRDAIRLGIGMTPEDRKTDGVVPGLSVRENIALVLQARRGLARPLTVEETRRVAADFVRRLGIRTPDLETPVANLSGGNQQKVLLARWMAAEPELLILDEPTRGIDIAAKADILSQVRALKARGVAVVFISSEFEEVLRIADRATVLRDRRSVATLSGDDLTEGAVVQAISQPHE
jgi:galactofuranose transport system ATP-binding protein